MRDQYAEFLLGLHSHDAPIFAVVDGASYKDLPETLWQGDFYHRPLYLDRGDNDPEILLTAPQLVVIDELFCRAGKRTAAETLTALLDALDTPCGVVFWHGIPSEERVFRHLRGLNMIHIPTDALPSDDQPHVTEDKVAVLFRHADANALAQVITSLSLNEASRLMGPAHTVVCQPDPQWRGDLPFLYLSREDTWPAPTPGLLALSESTMARMEVRREAGLQAWAVEEFSNMAKPAMPDDLVRAAYSRARSYRFEEKEDIWDFLKLERQYGPLFEHRDGWDAVAATLSSSTKTAKQRIFYASLACEELSEGQ